MGRTFLLALDQGTTGSTAMLVDDTLRIRGAASFDFPQHFPEPQWVEHDLEELWDSVVRAVHEVKKQAGADGRIAAIGITNQRETTCLWRRDERGTPLAKAIVWQDRRTASACEALRKKTGLEKKVHRKTGLLLDPYFSATKLRWLLDTVPGAEALAAQGKALFGTIDSFLLYRLSGGTAHRTDVSNASRTLLMDLKTCTWDRDMLKLFRIPELCLPEILPSSVEYGRTKNFAGLPDGIPVTGIAGDQQAALFGQLCLEPGMGKCTYGTGAFAVVNTGERIVYSKNRLLSTVAWKLGKKTTYALEGSSFVAGAAVQWIRDGLGLIETSAEVEALARTVPDSDGVLFVPALVGMGAPHWEARSTGLMTGFTRRTTKAHVARATLDGIAHTVADLLQALASDLGHPLKELRVDGGATENELLLQTQADYLGTKVVRPKVLETTSFGAALFAGLGAGVWKDVNQLRSSWSHDRDFSPRISTSERALIRARWQTAIDAVKQLAVVPQKKKKAGAVKKKSKKPRR